MAIGGLESDWETIGTLVVTSGTIALFDPACFDATNVALPRGDYPLQIKTMKYDAEEYFRVSRVRVLNATSAEPGKALGEVSVDAGTIGIVDAHALHPDFSEEWESRESEIENAWQSMELHGSAAWGDTEESIIQFVSTGFGDGTFKIQELVADGKRAGFEIEFIKPGTPYPFRKK